MFGRDPKARHQEQILRDFQQATQARERARDLLSESEAIAARAEAQYQSAKLALRRVSEGSV
jgi:sulfur transfer protein SufE